MSDVPETKVEFTINSKVLTEEEFEVEKKKLKEQNIKLVEVGANSFKTRLHD